MSVLRIDNAAGALLHEERLDTHNGLSKELSLGASTSGIVIVQLESRKRVLNDVFASKSPLFMNIGFVAW